LSHPCFAQHAAIVSETSARSLEALFNSHPPIRFFCLPCGDTAWKPLAYQQAEAVQARPGTDEWSLALDGTPVDAAYLYLKRKGKWVHAPSTLGIEFPSLPSSLAEGMREARMAYPDSAFAFLTWEGRYSLVDTLRKSDSHHPTTVEVTLWVHDTEGKLSARLEMNGLEISHRMILTAKSAEDSLSFHLHKYLKENFGQPFSIGSHLFTLIRSPGGFVMTRWAAWKPENNLPLTKGFQLSATNPFASEE
jgi:hypothetical protein